MQQGVVDNPTWMGDIRFFFRPVDIDHMRAKGIDLSLYDQVKAQAVQIYFQIAPPTPSMPPDEEGQWSADKAQTFKNWISNGCPQGTATPPADREALARVAPERVRKDVTTLDDAEIATLKQAFEGLMARDPSDPTSYYAIAGVHGLPAPLYCLHHEGRFNPWHRVYMKQFEDALRSVPGCEDVTIPYWDWTAVELPALLSEPPFASYTLPETPPGITPVPYTTSRYSPQEIRQNMQDYGVFSDVPTSLRQSTWGAYNVGGYQKFSIQAHDSGHVSIGETMADQDIASFDPVFWFFHCNIDRLWLSWQTTVGATDVQGFMSTLTPPTDWFTDPVWNGLPPYATRTPDTIGFGIGYDKLASVDEPALENTVGSLEAGRTFAIRRSNPVSVRVKDIDRLNIPGSFTVKLLADGEPIAKRGFFQPKQPRTCETCVKHALVNIDFRIDQDQLLDRRLSVEIEVPHHKEAGTAFPLERAGSPTVNARLLLEDE